MSAQEDLVKELVRLRRGWGMQSRDLRARIGPRLSRLCGIEDSDNGRRIQEKIWLWLQVVSADLPPELARAVLVAFALDRAHQHRKLTSRIESWASEQSWAPRTARRRIDHATGLIAQAALGHGRGGGFPSGRGAADADDGSADEAKPPALAAVVRLETTQWDAHEPRVVVMRIPVPPDRFDLLIRFEGT